MLCTIRLYMLVVSCVVTDLMVNFSVTIICDRNSADTTSLLSSPQTAMPVSRFEASSIRNKFKREEVSRKSKKAKGQQKLQKRLAQAKLEASDPIAKKVRYNARG